MIETVEVTGSTNADLLQRLSDGEHLEEGNWLKADRQTGGRGRLAREWQSPEGNLHCSTVVNLEPADKPAYTLSFVAGLAVFDCVSCCLLDHTPMMLKWPNDLLIRDGKVAGILLERHGDSVVIGVGVNVRFAPEIAGRKTTHLTYENGKFANGPDDVLDLLANAFAKRLMQWREQSLPDTLLEWAIRSHRFDDRMRVTNPDGSVIHGSYRGITPEGGLRLLPIGGKEMVVHAGDVSLLWHDEEEAN